MDYANWLNVARWRPVYRINNITPAFKQSKQSWINPLRFSFLESFCLLLWFSVDLFSVKVRPQVMHLMIFRQRIIWARLWQGSPPLLLSLKPFAETMHYASVPIEKLHYGIWVKCFLQSPFSQCIIFSDKIFGIQYLISFTFIIYLGTKWQNHQTRQAKALVVLLLVLDMSSFWGPVEWLSERERSFKYLDAHR